MFLFVSLFYWRIVALLKTAVLHRGWNDYETVVVWAGDRNQSFTWFLDDYVRFLQLRQAEANKSPSISEKSLQYWLIGNWSLPVWLKTTTEYFSSSGFYRKSQLSLLYSPLMFFFSISVFIVMNVFILVSEEAITTPNVMYGDAVVSCILHTPY